MPKYLTYMSLCFLFALSSDHARSASVRGVLLLISGAFLILGIRVGLRRMNQ